MLPNRLTKVISGGQSGSDVAGVLAAKLAGLRTGGTMPKGFLTLDGLKPDYARTFGMVEHPQGSYPPRTECNVKDSDATICIASDWTSAGERLTARLIREYRRPSLKVDAKKPANPQAVADWIAGGGWQTINVAGNSHRTDPSIGLFAFRLLLDAFELLGHEVPESRRHALMDLLQRLQTGIYAH